MQPYDLRVEYLKNPIGIDVTEPRFFWKLKSEKRGDFQTAYRIMTASSVQDLQEGRYHWDSGVVKSEETVGIPYAGKILHSGESFVWTVSVWDCEGNQYDAQETASFEMGLLQDTDWQGRFIGFPSFEDMSAQVLRRRFTLPDSCVRARAYICVPGYFEFYVNGQKQGDAVLEPGTTDYTKTLLYVTYDITQDVKKGDNVFSIVLGNGWYKNQRLLFQANIVLENGETMTVYSDSDENWTAALFPISYNHIYGGEYYDTRYEKDGWDQPDETFEKTYPETYWHFTAGYLPKPWENDSGKPYRKYFYSRFRPMVLPSPGGKLKSQMMEPIRVMEEITPVKVSEPKPGVYVFDVGQNIAGWISIRFHGKKGDILSIQYAEILYTEGENKGMLNRESFPLTLEGPKDMAHDRYVMRGEKQEVYEPRFTFHGFRYFSVEGLEYQPQLEDITVKKVYSSVESTGYFECSDDLLNTIHQNIRRTETNNLFSIPSDCPQRDERHGWLNDMTVRAEEAVYNYGMGAFYTKWLNDIRDTQDVETGAISDTAPYRRSLKPGDAVDSSFLIAGWLLYEKYGDKRIIEQYYDSFRKWAEYMEQNSIDGIVNFSYWGDWCPPIEYGDGCSTITTPHMVSTAYSYYNFSLLEQMAEALGKSEDRQLFERKREFIKQKYNEHYFHQPTSTYGSGSQGDQAISLYMGLVQPEDEAEAAKRISENIQEHQMHFITGNLCTRYTAEVMSDYGYVDDIYEVMTRTDYPSYGYMVANGATTIWERWELATGHAMNSHNHPMFGSIDVWFYKHLAGIKADYRKPGYKHIIFEPEIARKLDYVQCRLNTIRGDAGICWKKGEQEMLLEVEIPTNCTAELRLKHIPKEWKHVRMENEVIDREQIQDKLLLSSGKYCVVLEK